MSVSTSVNVVPLLEPTVSLLWITPDAEKTIVKVARVSSIRPNDTSLGLLTYLWKEGHVSPFQAACMSVEIETSREVARQIMRHWSLCNASLDVQEGSNEDYYNFYAKELRFQAEKNRQSSWKPSDEDAIYSAVNTEFLEDQKKHFTESIRLYNKWVDMGAAKEVARTFFPEGGLPTTLYLQGTIRSWMHYLEARSLGKVGIPQHEHKQAADKILLIVKEQMPAIYALIVSEKKH
jgi:thymidylate synthase (FAD)